MIIGFRMWLNTLRIVTKKIVFTKFYANFVELVKKPYFETIFQIIWKVFEKMFQMQILLISKHLNANANTFQQYFKCI